MTKKHIKELEKASKLLSDALTMINEAREIVEPIKDELEEKYDNMSERSQGSDNGQALQNHVEELTSAFECIESAEESTQDGMNYIDNCTTE